MMVYVQSNVDQIAPLANYFYMDASDVQPSSDMPVTADCLNSLWYTVVTSAVSTVWQLTLRLSAVLERRVWQCGVED